MAKWKYQGETFELDDSLSAAEATDQIERILEDRRAAQDAAAISGGSADESFSPPVTRIGAGPREGETKRDPYSDIGVGLAEGITKAIQGTTELAALYADIKYHTGIQAAAAADESIPANTPFPTTSLVTEAFES